MGVCVCVLLHIRDGRPGIFLRNLCVPVERRDDEPVLHLRCLPQVTALLPGSWPCHAQTGIRDEGMMNLYGPSHPLGSQLSDLDRKTALRLLFCQIWI